MWNKSTSIWWRHFIAPFRLVSWDSFYMILTEMILTRPSSWEDATFLRSNFTPGGKKCRSPPHFESFQPHYFSRTINFSLLISLSLSFRREGGGIPNHWKNVAKIRVIDVLHLERPGWVTHVWREKWNWRTFISVCFTLLLSGNSLAFIIKWAHCRWKFLFVYYLCIYLCVCVLVCVCAAATCAKLLLSAVNARFILHRTS